MPWAAADKISVTVTLSVNLSQWVSQDSALDLCTLTEIAVNLSYYKASFKFILSLLRGYGYI